jgi:hypothetical protein
MEGITEAVNNLNITDSSFNKKNRIQVSNTKKPLFFYVNLAKVYSFLFVRLLEEILVCSFSLLSVWL